MLQELSDECRRMGPKMNIAKINGMVEDNTPIKMNNVLIENVQGYVYLGQHYRLKEKNQDKEIQRRIMAGWAAYAEHQDIFKSNLAMCLKRHVYNSCVLVSMTYGAETWPLTKQAHNKLAAAQAKMERSMLNITYKDRKTNIWVRERTKGIDIINTVREMISHDIVSPEPLYNSQMFYLLSLPKLTIDTFTCDPLAYKEFMAIFDEVVDLLWTATCN